MRNKCTESLAVSCWITAALLTLFGLADRQVLGSSASSLEILLGIGWIPVGFVVRAGGPTARTVGILSGLLTVAIGAYMLVSGRGYFVGTITAIFLFARLIQLKEAFGAQTTASAPPTHGMPYGQPQYGQAAYGQPQYGQAPYGQPQYGQPQYGQPQYGQAPYGQPPYGQPQPPPRYYGQPQYGTGPNGQPPAAGDQQDHGFYAPPPRREG